MKDLNDIFNDKEYKSNKKKTKNTLIWKVIMFILTIGYLCFFIYEYMTKDFNLDNSQNIIKVILLLIVILLCGCTTITNSSATYFYASFNYILIFVLIGLSVISYLPKEKTKEVIKEIETEYMTCTGSNDISDKASIDITYSEDKINKLVYTYTFDIEKKDGAENLVNKFDRQYIEFDTIYSEITISDNIVVTFTYNIENISEDKRKLLDTNITSLKELKKVELNNMTCKSRGN